MPALIRPFFQHLRGWMQGRAGIWSHCIATLGSIKAIDLDDDVTGYSESLETLVVSLDIINRVVKPLGIEI